MTENCASFGLPAGMCKKCHIFPPDFHLKHRDSKNGILSARKNMGKQTDLTVTVSANWLGTLEGSSPDTDYVILRTNSLQMRWNFTDRIQRCLMGNTCSRKKLTLGNMK